MIQSLWNPFRDWKLQDRQIQSQTNRFKASETLLGIENKAILNSAAWISKIQSLWNPFRDWNWVSYQREHCVYRIQSLWNPFRDWNAYNAIAYARYQGFKASETLLGIETQLMPRLKQIKPDSKPLKPF